VEVIQKIADEYNLKVIYDAAHAFGVKIGAESVLNFGDLSILSFHATKVFNTFEGGAIICQDKKTKERIDHLKNFGIINQVQVVAPGINGKMSEFNAAFGMLQLNGYSAARAKRQEIDRLYRERLSEVKGVHCLPHGHNSTPNYGYFPVLIRPEYPLRRDALFQKLAENNLHARRYFYPLISHVPMYRNLPSAANSNLPVAATAANEILCLPIYPELALADVHKIIELIKT
jgi:dTDP-4-amino-4,6-dideoxygalactose transaminase